VGVDEVQPLGPPAAPSPSPFVSHLHVVYESAQHCLPGLQICAGLVFRWSESDDTCRVLEAADFLLGPPEDGLVCLAISKTSCAIQAGTVPCDGHTLDPVDRTDIPVQTFRGSVCAR
jgi:hypothetical protein